jgi:hypothetical protein
VCVFKEGVVRVVVLDHYSDKSWLFEGTPALIEQRILFQFPFLRSEDPTERGDLAATIEHLDATAAYQVEVENDTFAKAEPNLGSDGVRKLASDDIVRDMLGFQPVHTPAFQAARWLSGGRELPLDVVRRALYEEDGNVEHAALRAYGFEINPTNLKALQAVLGLGDLVKSEAVAATAGSVVAAHPEAEDVAQALRNAYKDQFVFPVALAGKHSNGALIARDEATSTTWLLKPGSGSAGAAAGSSQDPSTQAAREAAWYHIAKEWGMWNSYPRAELIIIDGRQYAAMALLPWRYKTAERHRKSDPNVARRVLTPYLTDGVLHQWAFLDAVLGNGDSHGQNLMFDDSGDVKLIDHGSAFAGPSFDPANDKNSFIPYYLRAWAPPDVNFTALHPEDKLRYMPRVPAAVARRISSWVMELDANALEAICCRYGVDPRPTLSRIAHLKAACSRMPADEAINRFWSGNYEPEHALPNQETPVGPSSP